MNAYKRLFDTLINEVKTGVTDNIEKLIEFIESKGHGALDYIESLDSETLEKLKGEADFNKIYEQFFNSDNMNDYSKNDDWFKEKEEKFRQESEKRRNKRSGNKKYSSNRTNHKKKTSSSYSSRSSSSNFNNSAYMGNDPFKIFGIPSNSKWRTIRSTYVKLVKKHHPDTRNQSMSPMNKKKSDLELQRIYKAWDYFNENKKNFH